MSARNHRKRYNNAALEVYYIRALITAGQSLSNDLTAGADGVQASQEAFDLGAVMEIASQRLTTLADVLTNYSDQEPAGK